MKLRELALILHTVNSIPVGQRIIDGYINATALCDVSGKNIAHYLAYKDTKDILKALEAQTGIPASESVQVRLVQIIRDEIPPLQGTWVHPYVAINLAYWTTSPQIFILVTNWFINWASGNPIVTNTTNIT